MTPDKHTLVAAYKLYVLENGKQPESVYAFAKKLEMQESEFYDHFNSFVQIESYLWKQTVLDTIEKIQQEEVYATYAVREKLLAFYYTWIEVLRTQRSFVLKQYEGLEKPLYMKNNVVITDAKVAFADFLNELIVEGVETREVERRPIPQLMQSYPKWLWYQALAILDFWLNDVSQGFEKTDVFIEKSVNTAMDLLGRSPLDSLVDLGKFLYQNRK